jgi:hypothetical protein
MSTSIELHNVVAVQINDTVVAKNTTTTWRELHFHKVNGEIVTKSRFIRIERAVQYLLLLVTMNLILMKGKTNGTFSTRHRDSA